MKIEWVEALKSGRYRQTRETLFDPDLESGGGYCCLGVLTDLYINHHGLRSGAPSYSGLFRTNSKGHNGDMPDNNVLAWADLTEDQATELVSLNDDDRADFLTIAEHIEKTL